MVETTVARDACLGIAEVEKIHAKVQDLFPGYVLTIPVVREIILAVLDRLAEPTEAMLHAAFDAIDPADIPNQIGDVWRAMLAAKRAEIEGAM